MDWLLFAVQWLHVLLGIFWFGFALSMYFMVAPALARMPEGHQRDVNGALGAMGARVFPIVSGLVLLLGIVRGTVFGPITSLEALFGTAYGITWLVALFVTIGLMVNGARYLGPAFEGIRDAPDVAIDMVLFGVVFTCMILMRFGL